MTERKRKRQSGTCKCGARTYEQHLRRVYPAHTFGTR